MSLVCDVRIANCCRSPATLPFPPPHPPPPPVHVAVQLKSQTVNEQLQTQAKGWGWGGEGSQHINRSWLSKPEHYRCCGKQSKSLQYILAVIEASRKFAEFCQARNILTSSEASLRVRPHLCLCKSEHNPRSAAPTIHHLFVSAQGAADILESLSITQIPGSTAKKWDICIMQWSIMTSCYKEP
jgi:hypothetical protein